MTFIPPEDYTVRLVDDMPIHQGGMIAESPDGHLNIYINARLSCSSQGAAFFHECDHANDDDLHSDRSIREVEDRAMPRKTGKLPKLMRARIDCSAELAHYGATLDGMPISNGIVDTYLLNASGVTVSAGGNSVTAYRITDAPILYTYASKIKQVITVPARLLDVRRVEKDGKTTGTRIATTESRLLIRDHLLNRISGMKGDNRLENRVIALNSYDRNGQHHIGLYEAAGYPSPTRPEAKRLREYAAQVLTYWAAIGWIKGYSEKQTGQRVTGIEIEL